MKNFLIRLALVGGIATAVVAATGAFFSDTEESPNNSLVAGAIDLKVDNTCYYNGQACVFDDVLGHYVWSGTQNECRCTWQPKDLEEGDTFFDLVDLKPGDWEEDTISLRVDNNDAWACVNIDNVVDQDVTCTEPEGEDGDPDCPPQASPDPTSPGELADELNFIFWADDGDNVLETDERILTEGPASNVLSGVTWALSDSTGSIFDPVGSPVPLVGERIYYIGKAWCYGMLTPSPMPQASNSPTVNPGILCDGEPVDNVSQTDKLTADISFYATQARNNGNFVCGENWPPLPAPTP